MSKFLNQIALSINTKLSVPVLLIFFLTIGLFYVAVEFRTQDMVQQRLQNRAFELAESFAVATEINNSQTNFVRVVNSIGAYADTKILFLLDDSAQYIVASSKNRYSKRKIGQLDDNGLKEQLIEAILIRQHQFLTDETQKNYFVYKLQTITEDEKSMRTMTLFMEIDNSSSEAYVRSITIYFFSTLIGLLTLIVLASYILVRRIILTPIQGLMDSIKATQEYNQPVISYYESEDQMGVLTKVYNELIVDSFSKQLLLTKEKKKSEMALQAKSQFLAMMTHELRTPLNGVIGMSGKLAELVTDPQKQKYLKVIQLSAQQLLAIINDTLDFSKIEADRLTLNNQPFDLVGTVQNVVAMFELPLQQKAVTLNIQLPEQTLPILVGDTVRLSQVLINLLGNAVKFTEWGSINVTIGVVESPQSETFGFTIGVKDSGIGLSEEQTKSLFQEFSQADSSTTRKYGGTGLGLWISKKLIEKMQGKIIVNSELGDGAEFIVHLSLAISEQQSLIKINSPEKIEVIDDSHGPINILLVEDTEINRMVVMAILETHNIHFTVAVNGLEAVNQFKQSKFDLIFMDCLMPIMDGFEASRQIRTFEKERNINHGTPIIALTANALEETRQQCTVAGMDEFLTKPVVPEKLHAAVKKWLKQKPVH
jgi:signal transduction histidine kinase/ActR/RegA family two-component response regulator